MTTGTGVPEPGQAPSGPTDGPTDGPTGEPADGPASGPADKLAYAPAQAPGSERWRGVERALLRMRRLVLLCVLAPLALIPAVVLALTAGPGWSAVALLPLAGATWGWGALARNWRSWQYAEREDDLLISRGVLWRELTVVPYGRMQLVEVASGPLERRYGLARLQLHTAAATTDATIPGLAPAEAERLRDRLTELGGARSAGL